MDNKDVVLKYFPHFAKTKLPNKQYMMNVLNTLNPGIILETLKDIKKKREKKEDENPVVISKFFAEKLNNFETIVPDGVHSGIHNIFQVWILSFFLLIFPERISSMQYLSDGNETQPCQKILQVQET